MPRPAYRSRSLRRVYVRTPGGRLVVHYEDRKVNPPRCAICGSILQGFPKMTRRKARRGHKPPGRPYGGCICPRCLSRALKETIRETYSSLIK